MKRHMVFLSAFLWLMFSGSSHAIQSYYAVTGVAPDDTLNVRAAPMAQAPILGTLSHDASAIEIVRTENGWGMFPVGETNGWVSMNYLEPTEPEMIGDTKVPEGLRCIGTEPFWSVTLTNTSANASHQNWQGDQVYRVTGSARSQNSLMVSLINFDDGVAFITPEQCFDGMSDAEFGWAAYFSLGNAGHHTVINGCCALPSGLERQ